MSQTFLLPEFETTEREKPVNVSSVPQRSPFRYPGGKTWLVPLFRRWMFSLPSQPKVLVEPFAGGGIISLTAVFEHLADSVIMVELDDQIAAVWQTILAGDPLHVFQFGQRPLSGREKILNEEVVVKRGMGYI